MFKKVEAQFIFPHYQHELERDEKKLIIFLLNFFATRDLRVLNARNLELRVNLEFFKLSLESALDHRQLPSPSTNLLRANRW